MNWRYRIFFRLVALAITLLFVAPQVYGQEPGNTVSQEGLFSYQAPKGWSVISNTNISKYKLAADSPKNNFSANINVVVEHYDGSLADYVAQNKKYFANNNIPILDTQPFTTTAGLNGYRLTYKITMLNKNIYGICYVFEGSAKNMFVVTGVCLVDDSDHYAPIFDTSMKTFAPQ